MSNPQEEVGRRVGSVLCTMPPNAPLPNTIPLPFQLNVQPGKPNVDQFAPKWTVSPGDPNIVYATVQLPAPGFQVPAGVNPQATGQSQSQQIFLKGKPKSLGIVLIVIAILQIGFGISLPFLSMSTTLFSGIPFWAPLFYIAAGSLTITAQKGLNLCRLKASVTLNIISTTASLIGIILNSLDLVYMTIYCYDVYDDCYYYGATFTILSFLLIINLLAFCVSISISVFGCRTLDNVASNTTTVFVIQNGYMQNPTFPTNFPLPQGPLPPPYLFQSDERVAPQ